MGSNLTTFRNNAKIPDNSPLLYRPITIMKEHFASFKAICDNFFLDLKEFEQIFGVGEPSFIIWDSDKNGVIDALELFAGLICFSTAKFEDKIRFLFEIFDLNEADVLCPVDIEFILFSSLSSAFKIYGIKKVVEVEEIAAFIGNKYSDPEAQINISNLIKFARENKEILEFFEIIDSHNKLTKPK